MLDNTARLVCAGCARRHEVAECAADAQLGHRQDRRRGRGTVRTGRRRHRQRGRRKYVELVTNYVPCFCSHHTHALVQRRLCASGTNMSANTNQTMCKQDSPSWRQARPSDMWCLTLLISASCLLRAVGTFAFAAPEMLLGVDSGVKVSSGHDDKTSASVAFARNCPLQPLGLKSSHTPGSSTKRKYMKQS